MFYLTTHSTHFIYGYIASVFSVKVKEGNVLFNDTLNTFYLRLYYYITSVFSVKVKEGNVLFNDAFNTFYLWL